MGRSKIALIGAGQIGAVLSHLTAQRRLGDVILFDIVADMPQGKALDLAEASRIDGFDVSVKGVNDYAGIDGADLVVVTAGIPRKPGMSRDDLLTVNSRIVRSVAEGVREYAPDAVAILISNPLDAMVTLFREVSGFPARRVFGQAGVLDSSRFSSFIAWELGVSVKDVNAMVLGGHGDAMVPLVRSANVNGIPVTDLLERKYGSAEKAADVMEAMVRRTRMAGGEVVGLIKNGSAFYSPASAAIAMAEAVLRDEHRVMPVCAYLSGEYGVDGCYVGVPAVLGAGGVERVLEVSLNAEEAEAFRQSAEHVRSLVDNMKSLKLL